MALTNFFEHLTNLGTKTVAIFLVLGFAIMMVGGLNTESAFSKVNYPGSDFGGVPLSFDLKLKSDNLKILESQGTLDLFVTVQYLDVGIIIGTLMFFTFLTLLIMKPLDRGSFFHKLGVFAVACFLTAPTMDALENISILTLIAYREQYELLWLSFMNSVFTLGKMTFFYLGWLLSGAILIRVAIMGLQSLTNRNN